MRPSQSGVYNQFPCSTGPEGLMRPSQSGVYNKFLYSTGPKGLLRPSYKFRYAAGGSRFRVKQNVCIVEISLFFTIYNFFQRNMLT
jgi:hypothetical protein